MSSQTDSQGKSDGARGMYEDRHRYQTPTSKEHLPARGLSTGILGGTGALVTLRFQVFFQTTKFEKNLLKRMQGSNRYQRAKAVRFSSKTAYEFIQSHAGI